MKIRGTAMHVAEKYQQLARDAQASGDRVMFESYNQHAEHYLRIVAAAQPQQQPATQQHARNEAEEGGESAAANGAASPPVNGSERPAQEQRATPDGDVVDANSPQPFIEDMPVIDQEGQVNGAGQNAEADDAVGEDKPRRRTRTPRARTPRRAATEASAETAPEATAETAETPAATAEDEQTKPRRRTTRTRRAKTAEEAPTEATATSE